LLEGLLKTPDFKLYYQHNIQAALDVLQRQVWRVKTWEDYLRLQGRYEELTRLARFPEELKKAKEAAIARRTESPGE
jgi:hypothetical protein